jgi:hypothetical protein
MTEYFHPDYPKLYRFDSRQGEPDYPLFYLFLAEFLADEGM